MKSRRVDERRHPPESANVADVTDPRSAERAIARAEAELGGLATVINIVGSASWALLSEMDDATWQRICITHEAEMLLIQSWLARGA